LRQEQLIGLKIMSDLEGFRSAARVWLEANCPPSMRGSAPNAIEDEGGVVWGGRRAAYKNPDAKLWLDRMGERGWTAPTWPRAYGGGGRESWCG
jgi:alkylation response protein AidB-like acyl-CoA dehydrogenase